MSNLNTRQVFVYHIGEEHPWPPFRRLNHSHVIDQDGTELVDVLWWQGSIVQIVEPPGKLNMMALGY